MMSHFLDPLKVATEIIVFYFLQNMNLQHQDNHIKVDFRHFIKLTKANIMSWDSLSNLLNETTSNFNLSKELNEILLEELKRSEADLVKHLAKEIEVERTASNGIVESKSIGIQTEDQNKETLEDEGMEEFQVDTPMEVKDEKSFEIKHKNKDETNKEDSLWRFDSGNDTTKGSNEGDTDQSHHINEKNLPENRVELPKEEKKYKCKKCDKAFVLKKSLIRHNNIHKDTFPYQCNTCSKVCSNNSDLIKHKRIHSGEKPFECKICKKAFSNSSHLKNHEKVHSGEKLYECTDCTKQFTTPFCLKRHKMNHTGERPYQCEHCGKRFMEPNTLQRHLGTHTGAKPYECKICQKSFTQSYTLLTHSRTHTQEGKKLYECTYCKKKVVNLYLHVKIHTKEKSHRCNVCEKCFISSSYLKKHLKRHTAQ